MSKMIEDLEVKVAFLEDALSKLSDEHYKQQKDLEMLKNQHSSLLERINRQDSTAEITTSVDDERPPHY